MTAKGSKALAAALKRVKLLEMELNQVRCYYVATAIETKSLDTKPDGFRHTPREIVARADEMLADE